MIPIAVAVAAACFGLGSPGRVDAVPYPGTSEISGTVQRIDSQTVTILVTGASRPEAFEWSSRDTHFSCDGAPTTVDSLRVGTYVQIDWSYHPLKGNRWPFAHRVFWDTSTSPKKSNPGR
jgi:hypothetical protein